MTASPAAHREACIVGYYEGPSDNAGRSCREIAAVAAQQALDSAGLSLRDVDGLLAAYAWEEPSIMFASEVADYLGTIPAYVETVCFGGASPAMMIARAARAIEQRLCDVVVVTTASNRASKVGRAGAIAALRDVLSPEFEVPYGAFIPPVYALTAARYMHEVGVTPEQLASVAVTQRDHARHHPAAARREPISVADVLASPVIASPLRLLDCCLVTDFGAAIVLTSADRASSATAPPVRVLGTGECHDRLTTSEVGDLTRRGGASSAATALREAEVSIEDVDFVELYDSFTITVLLTLENLGFCARGDAGPRAAEGAFGSDGDLPLNTNGGMLSYRTGGLSHVIEAAAQLRGTALGVRLEQPGIALVHGIGGALSAHCTLVLGAS
jgi:acetyl-CoA acetyltransferase